MTDRTMTLTVSNMRALADRLWARGFSKFGQNHSSEGGDFRTAARILWHYAAEFSSPESTITIPADE